MKKVKFENPPHITRTMKESLRTVRTNIEFCGDDINSIVMTSTVPNEGKTTVSMNLAISLTENGKNVLLVDADMRKSVLLGRLRVRSEENEEIFGLSHYLSGQQSLSNVVYQTEYPGLYTIFAGPTVSNATEIIQKKYFDALLEFGKEYFDYVIIDTPPVTAAVDAQVIANKCDGAVLVIGQGMMSTKIIANTKRQLEGSGVHILGAVLNFVQFKNNYYSKYYKKNYGQYYSEYYYGGDRNKKKAKK